MMNHEEIDRYMAVLQEVMVVGLGLLIEAKSRDWMWMDTDSVDPFLIISGLRDLHEGIMG